jgi:hypothetical protein
LIMESKRSLRQIVPSELPRNHPVCLFLGHYEREKWEIDQAQLPNLENLLGSLDPRIADYCMLLESVTGDPYLDFIPLNKGEKVPGVESTRILRGEHYTHHIAPHLANERVLELASCIILKSHRLTEGLSARSKTLKVKVFRGVFPVWQMERQKPAVLLFIAPPYAEVQGENGEGRET